VNGEKKAGRILTVSFAVLAIGESGDEGFLLPVHGEKVAATG